MTGSKKLRTLIAVGALFVGLCGISNTAYAADDSTATATDAVIKEEKQVAYTGGVNENVDSEPVVVNNQVNNQETPTKTPDALTELDGVDYSAVYDYDYYIAHNPDVARAFNGDQEKTLQHFVTYGMKEKRQASEDFNVSSYIKLYADLRNAFGEDTVKYFIHFINYGNKEHRRATGVNTLQNPVTVSGGVDYKDVYNYDYYTSKNPDVKNAFASKNAPDVAVLNHFLTYGVKEKRVAKDDFDIKSYVNAYADLRRAFGTDWSKYLTHYEKYGKKESRKASGVNKMVGCLTTDGTTDYKDVYDYNYYIGKYGDIRNIFAYDDAGALKHFINYGMNEGRQGKETFDVNSYKRSYQDLRVAFYKDNKKYYEHYISYGKNEGRKSVGETVLQNPVTVRSGVDFSPVYDYYFYTAKNPDVAKAFGEDDIATLNHFVKYGLNEGRTAKSEYNPDDYATLKEKANEILDKEDIERIKARGRARNPKAAAILDSIGWNLEKAFLWTAKNISYYGKYEFDASWGSSKLAQYGLENRKGNCYVFAGVFYEFAKVLGADAHQIAGHIPKRNGGEEAHSWVEIVVDGNTYYCDPEQKWQLNRDAFMKPYGAKGLWKTINYRRMN